ncbi:MAG: phosphotransferase [Pirellulaceae bacterium]
MSVSIIRVLQNYGIGYAASKPNSQEIEALGSAGGFSGAEFWKITTGANQYCLRRWPNSKPTRSQADVIYPTLEYVRRHADLPLAFPIQTVHGEPLCRVDNARWELSRWMPGEPIAETEINDNQLRAAARALAEFHNTTSSLSQQQRASPAIDFRSTMIDRLWATQFEQLQGTQDAAGVVDSGVKKMLLDQFRYQAHALRQQLELLRSVPVLLIPIIGDIWSDHVLFNNDEVSGIVDFGAMKLESPCLDIARLFGSYADYSPEALRRGISYYGEFRELNDLDLGLIELYDRGYVILAGIQWLIWIELEQRIFLDNESVRQRLHRLVRRCEPAI